MSKLSLNKIFTLLIEICLWAIVFLLPLYFAIILKTANVFELNKLVIFKILVLILLFLTIAKGIFGFEPKKLVAIRHSKKRLLIFIIPFSYLAVLAVSSLFSIDPAASIFGSYSRQMGLLSYVYCLLFFVLLLINIKEKEQVRRIIFAIVFSSFFVSLYGIFQAAGYEPLGWSESTAVRAFSTIGQPNLLAMYLLLVIPMSAYLIFTVKRAVFKVLSGLALFTDLLCLLFTYSLSGWVGLIGGMFFTGIIYIISSFPRRRESRKSHSPAPDSVWSQNANDEKPLANGLQAKPGASVIKQFFSKKKVLILAGLLTIAILVIAAGIKIQPFGIFKDRWSSLTNLQSASLSSRFNWWRAGGEAMRDAGSGRLLFGYGPETQNEIIVKYYQKDWGVYEDINVRPDRLHNLFLDILFTTGIVGLLVYLALLFLFFRFIFQILKNDSGDRLLGYAILGALLSYLIALQLNFTFVAGEVYFWLYLALAIIVVKQPAPVSDWSQTASGVKPHADGLQAKPGASQDNKETSGAGWLKPFKLFVIILAGGLAIILINQQVGILTADYYLREMRLARKYNQYFAAIRLYEFIKENVPGYGPYDRQFANIMAPWLEDFNDQDFRIFGEAKLKQVLAESRGDNLDDIFARAMIYGELSFSDKTALTHAEENYLQLIALCPAMPLSYGQLASLYSQRGEAAKAIEYYNMELARLPDLNTPDFPVQHLFAARGRTINIYLSLGDIYAQLKDKKNAEKYYNLALSLDDKYPGTYQHLADYYFTQGDFDRSIWYNEKGMELDSGNYEWPYSLSQIYIKQGKKDLAAEFLKKAQALTSENLDPY